MAAGIGNPGTIDVINDVVNNQLELARQRQAADRIMLFSRKPELFPEQAYLQANPDVAAAVQQGLIPSGLSHYTSNGAWEGRQIADEQRYLALNPDVAAAVAAGHITAQAHMLNFGLSERRPGLEGVGTHPPLFRDPTPPGIPAIPDVPDLPGIRPRPGSGALI